MGLPAISPTPKTQAFEFSRLGRSTKEGLMSKIPRSADLLVNKIMSSPDGLKKLSQDPEKTLREFAREATVELIPPVMKREAGIYYVVVWALGIVAAITPVNETVRVPDVITALGSAAIGALAGLLAPSPKAT
jgi:hypothetical protein